MTEVLNLSDRASVEAHRGLLIASLPEVLAIAEAHDQIAQLERGRPDEVVSWFTGHVSVGGHGANAGTFGLNEEQTLQFNPIAKKVGLMAPTRLWTPDDDLPRGARIGDIVEYSVIPDWTQLPAEIFKSEETVVVDATVDGTVGRIGAGLGAAVRSEAVGRGEPGRLTVLTGLRAVKPAEGNSGLYKQFLPEGMDPGKPIDLAFPTATDATLAILRQHCTEFELIHEVEDPKAGNKSADQTHPVVAPNGRTWIARYYGARHKETGKELLITVVNGEPIAPTGDELNRSKSEPAPRAGDTLMDYLGLPLTLRGKGSLKNLAISYAHLGRIGAELRARVAKDAPGAIGGLSLVGSMPQPATWNKIINGNHNGGTLGVKEYYPFLKALNVLSGRDPRDLSL